jgi:hypothetical protein
MHDPDLDRGVGRKPSVERVDWPDVVIKSVVGAFLGGWIGSVVGFLAVLALMIVMHERDKSLRFPGLDPLAGPTLGAFGGGTWGLVIG